MAGFSCDEYAIGRETMLNFTVELDGRKVSRGAFGLFHWRLLCGRVLIWLACLVLRCGFVIRREEERDVSDKG